MTHQHFLFGSQEHLPFERRVIHFAETGKPAPEEVARPEKPDSTLDVHSQEFKNWQAKLAKEGILIGSLADHRMESTTRVVNAPYGPRPEMHPYDGRCCPPAVKPHLDACLAEPACPPGFTKMFEKAAVEARVCGHCEGAARTHMVAAGRLPDAPARAPRAGDRRVWPREDGSVGYQLYTVDKGWVWSSDYNPQKNPNRWKGIQMKDPPASMMRDYGRSGGGDRSTGGDRRGGFAVYRSDDAERTTYATGADRPDYRPPLSSIPAKDRRLEKILRDSETPLSRARARADQASFDQIAAAGAAGRNQGSTERLNRTAQSDLRGLMNRLNLDVADTFELGKSEVLSRNGRVSIQASMKLGSDSINRRVYRIYVQRKFQGEFSTPEEVAHALLTGNTKTEQSPADKNAVENTQANDPGFRPRNPDRKPKEETPPNARPPESKTPDTGPVPSPKAAPEKPFMLPPEVTAENSIVIPSGVAYIMFRQPDGNVRMVKFNGTDTWTAINGENAKFMQENGIRMYVETYQADGRTLHRHYVHFTKPGRYEVGTKDPQQRDRWYAPKDVQ